VEQLQLLDLMISRECGAVPMDAATRADLIDLLSYLLFAGLPKVDDRLASQMLRFDFGIVQELCHFLLSPFSNTAAMTRAMKPNARIRSAIAYWRS
jgi:hypothetical protein